MNSAVASNPLNIPSNVEDHQNPHYTPHSYAPESNKRGRQLEGNEVPLHGTDSIVILSDDSRIHPIQVANTSSTNVHNLIPSIHGRLSGNVGNEARKSDDSDHLTHGVEDPILTHGPDCASTSREPRVCRCGLSGSPSSWDGNRYSKINRNSSPYPAEPAMPFSSNAQGGCAPKWGGIGRTKVYTLKFVRRWFSKRSLANIRREKNGPSTGKEPIVRIAPSSETEKQSEQGGAAPPISPLLSSLASPTRPTLNHFLQHDSFNYPSFIWDISRPPMIMIRRVENTPVLSWTATMFCLDEGSRSEYATNPPVREIYINGLADFPLVKVAIGPDILGDSISTLPWPIRVRNISNPMGYVTCGDVFDAIYINFQEFLGEKEMAQMTPFRQYVVHAAYKVRKMRLKNEYGDRESYEHDRGFRRCDYLAMQVMFRGLEPSPDSIGWTLCLGPVIM